MVIVSSRGLGLRGKTLIGFVSGNLRSQKKKSPTPKGEMEPPKSEPDGNAPL
jgi:hypothetical protein